MTVWFVKGWTACFYCCAPVRTIGCTCVCSYGAVGVWYAERISYS